MKPVNRCTCGCIMSVQRIKTPNAIVVRFVCFRCYKTKRRFFMRSRAVLAGTARTDSTGGE